MNTIKFLLPVFFVLGFGEIAYCHNDHADAYAESKAKTMVLMFNTFDSKNSNVILTIQYNDSIKEISHIQEMECANDLIQFTYGEEPGKVYKAVTYPHMIKMIRESKK